MSELSDLELTTTEAGRRYGKVRDAWLELGDSKVAYISLGGPEREVPIPLQSCSIVAVPRARALQLCIDLGDTRLEKAPALSPNDANELDDEAFRVTVAAHFPACVAQLSGSHTPRRASR